MLYNSPRMRTVTEFVRLQQQRHRHALSDVAVVMGRPLIKGVPVPPKPKARCLLPDEISGQVLTLDDSNFSKHILIVGSIGTGKTNFILWVLWQIKRSLGPDDLLIIFDTKGDFKQAFYTPGDIVIANDDSACGVNGPDYWNIFRDMMCDRQPEDFALEAAARIFAADIERSNQPFFPRAAQQLFAALMVYLHRLYQTTGRMMNNYILRTLLDRASGQTLINMLSAYPDMQGTVSYISHPQSPQTQGVISQLQQGVRSVFIGNFARAGNLSIRELVRQKGGKTVFIAYDIQYADVLTPIYVLLIDQALKEALGRARTQGNVWLFIDEFRLLPKLKYLENALNFGRSLGVKLVVAMQNINQVYEAYGRDLAESILSGFTTVITFGLTDGNTREFVAKNSGKQRRLEIVSGASLEEDIKQIHDGNVIEDWMLASLGVGEALISIPGYPVFLHKLPYFDPNLSVNERILEQARLKVQQALNQAPAVRNGLSSAMR